MMMKYSSKVKEATSFWAIRRPLTNANNFALANMQRFDFVLKKITVPCQQALKMCTKETRLDQIINKYLILTANKIILSGITVLS